MEGILQIPYVQNLIAQYGIESAMKMLGLDEKFGLNKQYKNPKYALSIGGQSINPINMLKRAGINTGIKSLMGGNAGMIAPLALGAGAIYFLNKNRKKFTGYDTQRGWEDARTERIANKRLDYITDRMLNDKKYGNYEEALLDSGAGAVKIDDNIISGADYFPTYTPKAAKDPLEKFESIEDITRTDIPDRKRGQDNVSILPSKTISKAPSRQSRYTSGPGGLHSNYSRGGIAGLWRR